ncbi:hypothetical protein [Pseudoalteromonas marina]|uniref:Uncharacterized protein n=3 Tax=Bacteria TaxID=2 RepID=A0ABT9FCH6_9GAMM|nr:hypothetical protein [Pseudoalteromonas marina]MDP2564438.1 hypothetical protein [Pseudoalteromonas marina]
MKHIAFGWGRSGVGNRWLMDVMDSIPFSLYECDGSAYADTRVIAFSSLEDVAVYLRCVALDAPQIACRLPVHVINNCSESERDLIVSLLVANDINPVAYFPPSDLSIESIRALSLRDKFYYPCSQVLEVVFFGCEFGTEIFWKKRARVLRNIIEYYFDKGDGFRLNGLYGVVIKYDDDVRKGNFALWSDYVMDMVASIASVLGCDFGEQKIDNCFVTNVRYALRDGRSILPAS